MRLTLATWNIRKCVGLDRRRDPHRIARVIDALDAPIVALQEADRRLGHRPAALRPDIIESETRLRPVEAGGFEPSIGWHGNALLVDDRTTIEDTHGLHLPGIEPRGALVIDLQRDDTAFRVVATHLGFLRRYRRAQLATIRAYLDSLPDRPTVLLGDFNEWSPRRGFEPLTGFDIVSPGNTFHSARPVAPLDRFALGDGTTLVSCEVIHSRDTRVASDHLPVRAKIEVQRGA